MYQLQAFKKEAIRTLEWINQTEDHCNISRIVRIIKATEVCISTLRIDSLGRRVEYQSLKVHQIEVTIVNILQDQEAIEAQVFQTIKEKFQELHLMSDYQIVMLYQWTISRNQQRKIKTILVSDKVLVQFKVECNHQLYQILKSKERDRVK